MPCATPSIEITHQGLKRDAVSFARIGALGAVLDRAQMRLNDPPRSFCRVIEQATIASEIELRDC